MAYDFHGSWDGVTGHNAPLVGSELSSSASIRSWIKAGASPAKLVLGIPIYCRTFTLSDVNQYGVGAPGTEPGAAGPYSNEAGMLTYLEVRRLNVTSRLDLYISRCILDLREKTRRRLDNKVG